MNCMELIAPRKKTVGIWGRRGWPKNPATQVGSSQSAHRRNSRPQQDAVSSSRRLVRSKVEDAWQTQYFKAPAPLCPKRFARDLEYDLTSHRTLAAIVTMLADGPGNSRAKNDGDRTPKMPSSKSKFYLQPQASQCPGQTFIWHLSIPCLRQAYPQLCPKIRSGICTAHSRQQTPSCSTAHNPLAPFTTIDMDPEQDSNGKTKPNSCNPTRNPELSTTRAWIASQRKVKMGYATGVLKGCSLSFCSSCSSLTTSTVISTTAASIIIATPTSTT